MNNLIKKDNTLIIIDWDDTLLPSSALFNEENMNGRMIFNMDFDKQQYIFSKNEINETFIEFIKYANNIGTVIIITSSKENWVLYSANEYLSCEATELLKDIDIYYVQNVLEKYNIKNVSTERKKEVVFEIVINEWIDKNIYKFINPLNIIFNNNNRRTLNVVSLGDGFQELNAYNYITKKSFLTEKIKLIYKHIEYIQQPSYTDLLTEYKLIKNKLFDIANDLNTKHYKFIVMIN